MTNRERFRMALEGRATDRPCHVEHGFWKDTLQRWRVEGLPEGVSEPEFAYLSKGEDLFRHFDVMKFGYILPSEYFLPAFPETLLEETQEYKIYLDAKGVKIKVLKNQVSMPQFLEYPIKCRADYDRYSGRLGAQAEKRYPAGWDQLAREMVSQQDTIVCLHMDGFFAHPRELMGLETFLETLYDDPDLIAEMISGRVDFYIQLMEKPIRNMKPDMAFVWEDMCYRNGPLLSPAQFRQFMLPAYRKLTDFLRRMGVGNVVVDSDGQVDKLIPLWLEGGVTGLLPFEVRAGMDVVKVGREYPELKIFGGIDKHEIAKGKDAIDRELGRVLPEMLKRGRYLVSLDHWVPPTISLDDFRYYVESVRAYQTLG